MSGRVGNGVAHPMGSVTGTFSLRSLVDYDDDDDEDTADGDKGARLFTPLMRNLEGLCSAVVYWKHIPDASSYKPSVLFVSPTFVL